MFHDRRDAGQQLADRLFLYAGRDDVIVLGLPRGGVPVAYEVACALEAPLDVCVVRKLGVPGHEELAMGAIAFGGVRVVNPAVTSALDLDEDLLDRVTRREMAELERRQAAYRDDRPFPEVEGKTVVLVDDGLATGSTMQAAVSAVRELQPAAIVVAVPVAPPDTCRELRSFADDVICAITPQPFFGVGVWYRDFSQTSDDEVRALLDERNSQLPPASERRGDLGAPPGAI